VSATGAAAAASAAAALAAAAAAAPPVLLVGCHGLPWPRRAGRAAIPPRLGRGRGGSGGPRSSQASGPLRAPTLAHVRAPPVPAALPGRLRLLPGGVPRLLCQRNRGRWGLGAAGRPARAPGSLHRLAASAAGHGPPARLPRQRARRPKWCALAIQARPHAARLPSPLPSPHPAPSPCPFMPPLARHPHPTQTPSTPPTPESIEVVPGVGVALRTRRRHGGGGAAFIDAERIRAVIINEASAGAEGAAPLAQGRRLRGRRARKGGRGRRAAAAACHMRASAPRTLPPTHTI
jgi:hypothetical protein